MIDLLMGVPKKLKTLLDRLTSTRAAKLDYLTAEVAPKDTALAIATWTNARAGYLDKLGTTPGILGTIKSVQRGSINLTGTSGTASITAVDTNKAILIFLGANASGSIDTDPGSHSGRVALTSSTQVTAYRGRNDGNYRTDVGFCVVEFY